MAAPVRRTHISLPADLVAQIDALVGRRNRSSFLAELADREVKKRRLIEILRNPEPIMKDEDHPDIVAIGTAEWVRRLRGHTDGVGHYDPQPPWQKKKAAHK